MFVPGQNVEMKNRGEESWLTGYVTSIKPTEVGLMRGAQGAEWDCVRTAAREPSAGPATTRSPVRHSGGDGQGAVDETPSGGEVAGWC